MQLEPAVGEVWRHIITGSGRLAGIYLIVLPPRVYAPPDKPQVEQLTMLELESGKVKRFNARVVHAGNGWSQVTHVRHLGLEGLGLKAGDTVVTAKGTFTVLKAGPRDIEALWLETGRVAVMWLSDSLYGPLEVHRKDSP